MAVMGATVPEPTNAELKALIESLISSNDRDKSARIEWQTRTGDRVEKLTNTMLGFEARLVKAETAIAEDIPKAKEIARVAQKSSSDLEQRVREEMVASQKAINHVASTMERKFSEMNAAQNPLLIDLQKKVTAAAAKEEEREVMRKEKEAERALASASLASRRRFWIAVLSVLVPLSTGLLNYYTSRSAHEPTEQRVEHMERQLEVVAPNLMPDASPTNNNR